MDVLALVDGLCITPFGLGCAMAYGRQVIEQAHDSPIPVRIAGTSSNRKAAPSMAESGMRGGRQAGNNHNRAIGPFLSSPCKECCDYRGIWANP